MKITSDDWILKIVQEGLKLVFIKHPPNTGVRITNVQDVVQRQCILEEIESLLEKHAIEIVPKTQEGQGFYSTFFVVPKRDGGYRPILNLKPLNIFLQNQHFKMESLRSIIQALNVGDWVASIDLKDAYLHVPIYPEDRKYLRFCIDNIHYQFRSMPFGLATAPRVFTKLMGAIGAHLRSQQISIYMYLDDWLLKNADRMTLVHQLRRTLFLLMDLGLVINQSKSILQPTQQITYLGALFNLQQGMVYPSLDRFLSLRGAISTMVMESFIPARTFLRVLGLMAACIDLVPLARLKMRPIQFCLLSQWRPHVDELDHLIQMDSFLIPHLLWWIERGNVLAGTSILSFRADLTLWTDASTYGWGAHLEDRNVSGKWTVIEQSSHINLLELSAVENALHHFRDNVKHRQVLLRTDNSTVVSYINRQGGTKSAALCVMTWRILHWCHLLGIQLKAAHIPGKKNVIADQLSRGRQIPKMTEWSLNQEIVQQIFRVFPTPNIDLFATRENRKLAVFCSPFPDPLAWECDALAVDWTGMFAYAFPPPILIPKVLRKVEQESCVLLLIAPFSPRQSWFPDLLHLLVDIPRELPIIRDMLTQRRGQFIHPSPESLHLAVWKISNNKEQRIDFLRKLSHLSSTHEDSQQEKCMMLEYESTRNGVPRTKRIQLRPL